MKIRITGAGRAVDKEQQEKGTSTIGKHVLVVSSIAYAGSIRQHFQSIAVSSCRDKE